MKKNEKQILSIIILLGLLFLIIRIISGNYLLNDSYEYLAESKKIHNFIFSQSQLNLSSKRPVIYPLFLSIFHNLPYPVIIFVQTLITILTLFINIKIIEKFQVNISKDLLWFIILTPSIFIYSQLIMTEWLIMFFLTCLFWLLLQKFNNRNFILIQFLVILLAFTKPVFYPLIYFNFLFFAYYFIKKRIFNFWIFVPVIVLQLFMYYKKSQTGYKHFSTMENINLINYNLYYFKAKTESVKKADIWIDSIYNSNYRKMNFAEKNKYLHNIAKKELENHFFKYSFYHLFTAIRGIFDPGRFDLMTFFKNNQSNTGLLDILNTDKSIFSIFKNKYSYIYLLLIPIFLMNLIKWYYFIKYLILKKLDLKIYYLIGILLFYILITGPVNTSRYMMPLQGIVIIFAFLGRQEMKKNQDS